MHVSLQHAKSHPFSFVRRKLRRSDGVLSILLEWRIDDHENRRYAYEEPHAAQQHHKVAHAHLKSSGIEFSATDWLHPKRAPKPGNTVAMYINGGTYNELRKIFDSLATGADKALLDDLQDMPFGTYGHLADRYGVHWFFQGGKAA